MFHKPVKKARFVCEVPDAFGYTSPNNILSLGQTYTVEDDFTFGKLRIIRIRGFKNYFPATAFEIFEE